MGLTTHDLERWTGGKQSSENSSVASVARSVSNVNLRSNEASSSQLTSSTRSASGAVPVARPISNIHLIPAATSNPSQSEDSFIRQNYATDVEAALNKQINIELHASYVYLSMSYYFDRGDATLPNIAKWLKKRSDEKREHAQVFMKYQNSRGGRIVFQNVQKPEMDEWGSAFETFQAALALEKFINNVLLELHSLVSRYNDPQMCIIFSVSSGAQDAPAAPGTSTPATLVPVLLSMSPEERQQLEDILVKTNLTVKEMNDQVDDFFNGDSISPSLKSQYLAMKQAFAESLEVLNQEHDKAIQNASPECQKADAEVRAIAQDENLTMAEQNIRIFKIYQAQTPEVRKELNQYAIYKRTGESSSSSGF